MYGLKKEVFNDIINVIKKYENIEIYYRYNFVDRTEFV